MLAAIRPASSAAFAAPFAQQKIFQEELSTRTKRLAASPTGRTPKCRRAFPASAHRGMVSGRGSGRDQSGAGTIGSHAILTYLRPNRHDGSESRASLASTVGLHAGVTSYPTIASMSASIRDRLIALALYRMASATPGADEAPPQSHSNANPISLLERLYRLRLVSAGILWRGG